MTKLNRHLNSDLLMLFALGFLLNVDRLVMGEYGFLRQLDVSNWYLNKMLFLSNYWTIPIEYGWNSSILRGWPSEIGSIGPQYFGVLLAAVFPIEYVFPILHLIIDVLVLYGAYLFVNIFLGFRRETAIFGAFLFLGINYWYNENPLVTASPLLPLLVAVTSYGKKQINHSLRFVSLILITSLSFPPYVLPIMQMAHVLFLLVFDEKTTIKQNLIYAVLFWVIYTLFHGISILGYLQYYDISNRSLWEGGGQTGSFIKSFLSSINHTVLFPALIVFALANKNTIKPVLWATASILFILTITALIQSELYNSIVVQYPHLKKFSFFFSRTHNFIGITVFLALGSVLEEFVATNLWNRKIILLTGTGLSAVMLLIVFKQHGIKMTILHFMCSVVIIGSFYFYRQRYFRNGIVTLILLFIVVAPFRISYSMMREQLYQGNLFIDPFTYETEKKAFRVATIMDKPWSYDFFDAQVSIKGLETFGGNSVFYSGSDVKQWQYYVSDDAPSWEGLGYTFKNWNNRIELVKEDYEANPDRIIYLMRLNNVLFVRSRHLLEHPQLNLIKSKTVDFNTKRTLILGKPSKSQHHYLYQIKNPVSRVFSIPSSVGDSNEIKFDQKEYGVFSLKNIDNIKLIKYTPSIIEFEGTFGLSTKIYSTTNYSNKWSLYIGDELKNNNIKSAVNGMIEITPIVGTYKYKLEYQNASYLIIYILSAVAIFLFLIFSINLKQNRKNE